MRLSLTPSTARILRRSLALALLIYLFVAFVSWEFNPGAWTVDGRGPAVSIYAFGVFLIWLLELD